jgi:hypothetical protein
VGAYPRIADLPDRPQDPASADLLVPLLIQAPIGDMHLLTTIATIGAPFDVTLEEVRLETDPPSGRRGVRRGLASVGLRSS